MHTDMVVVSARFRALPGKEEALKSMVQQLVQDCEGQNGLILYSVHQDVADPALFQFYEQFASQAALDEHAVSKPLKDFERDAAQYMTGKADVRIMRMLARVTG
ncbi:putative quinol monooxygenase [Desulfobaculum sp.]